MRVRSYVMATGALGVCGLAALWLFRSTPEPEPVIEAIPDRFVEIQAPPVEATQEKIAENSGVLGSLSSEGSFGGLGGGGTAVGAGGLGTKGSGSGGGGGVGYEVGYGAVGRGAIGQGSIGSGSSGYGSGGGSFGARGPAVAPVIVHSAPTYTPPLSQDWDHAGFNPTELAERDRLSTFSIDVDTASYTQARRQIRARQIPAAASVRTEEFVNYFRYDYPEPEQGRPFSITMDGAEHPWSPGHHLLRVGIQGARDNERARTPVHLTFLVDVSGSMRSADKLPLAKQALNHLVDHLEEGDTVGIATYAGATSVVLDPTDASTSRAIHRAIDGLENGGGTAMSSGMQLAYDMALKTSVPGEENRVIVLSDGDANIGPTSHEQILNTIAGYANQGITLSTVGFGTGNYRDALMEQLADKGDGNYAYIDSIDEAKRVFGEDLGSTIRTIARDVKIQVEFDLDNVIAYTLIGYENREIADKDFRNDAVDAGEVGAGHTVTALYDVVLRDNPAGSLATVRVRHKEPGPDVPATETAVALPARAVSAVFERGSRDLRLAFGAAAFAEKLRGGKGFEEVGYDEIARVIRQARRPGDERDTELIGLVESVRAMDTGSAPKAAEIAIDGTLGRVPIEEVVGRSQNQLRYCYQRELTKDPSLSGDVVVRFIVAPTGDVAHASVLSTTLGSPAVESCLAGRFIRMQFPSPPDGSKVKVDYPLSFRPA